MIMTHFDTRLIGVLLALVSFSCIQCIGFGNCPRQEFLKDFNLTRFLGHWYEVERSFHFMELLSTCTTINLEQVKKRQANVTVTTFNRWTGSLNIVEGVASVSRRDPSIFIHRRALNWPVAIAKWLPGHGSYQVLSTDYDNYAVLWTCTNNFLGLGYSDLIWIFSRQSDLDAHSRLRVYDILKTRKIDPDRFTLTNRNCTDL